MFINMGDGTSYDSDEMSDFAYHYVRSALDIGRIDLARRITHLYFDGVDDEYIAGAMKINEDFHVLINEYKFRHALEEAHTERLRKEISSGLGEAIRDKVSDILKKEMPNRRFEVSTFGAIGIGIKVYENGHEICVMSVYNLLGTCGKLEYGFAAFGKIQDRDNIIKIEIDPKKNADEQRENITKHIASEFGQFVQAVEEVREEMAVG